jgi:hypothetical protein
MVLAISIVMLMGIVWVAYELYSAPTIDDDDKTL